MLTFSPLAWTTYYIGNKISEVIFCLFLKGVERFIGQQMHFSRLLQTIECRNQNKNFSHHRRLLKRKEDSRLKSALTPSPRKGEERLSEMWKGPDACHKASETDVGPSGPVSCADSHFLGPLAWVSISAIHKKDGIMCMNTSHHTVL